MIDPAAMEELKEPLTDLGQRWARSPHRPRPAPDALEGWDELLDRWAASDLPLVLRDSARRSTRTYSMDGREVLFGDNTPANWSLGLALDGQTPDISTWTKEDLHQRLPLSMIGRSGFKRDLNRVGWKVCHIDPVSDRKRIEIEGLSSGELRKRFVRFLSPRNMFVIPKAISGAGELEAVIRAVADYDKEEVRL